MLYTFSYTGTFVRISFVNNEDDLQKELYQLLSYTDDVDINKKLEQWKNFYNFNRPHGLFKRENTL